MTPSRAAMCIYDYLTRYSNGQAIAAPIARRFPEAAELAAEYAAQYLSERSYMRHAQLAEPTSPLQQETPRNLHVHRAGRRRRGRQDFLVQRIGFRNVARTMAIIGSVWGLITGIVCIYSIVLMFILGETPPGDILAPVYEKMVELIRALGYDFEDFRTMDRELVSRLLGLTTGGLFLISPIFYGLVFAAIGCLIVLGINIMLRVAGGMRVTVRQDVRNG